MEILGLILTQGGRPEAEAEAEAEVNPKTSSKCETDAVISLAQQVLIFQ
jgi:hypothetical protein